MAISQDAPGPVPTLSVEVPEGSHFESFLFGQEDG